MKCTRVLRRVTSGALKYNSANSRARLSALPFGTTSATLPIRVRYAMSAALGSAGRPPLVLLQRDNFTLKGSVARYDASREVRDIVEGRTLGRHNHTGKQRIL